MHYLCLLFFHRAALDALPPEQRTRLHEELRLQEQALQACRCLATVAAVADDAGLRLVGRHRPAALEPLAGGAANAPLQGFYRLEARDLNDAIRLAGELPLGRLGVVEVRAEVGWEALFERPAQPPRIRSTSLEDCLMNNPANLTASGTDEARIRELCEVFADATNHKNLDRIMAQYADDIVAFDCIGPVRFTDRERYRQHWQACFEMCQGGFFRMQDLQVELADRLAFCHFIAECGGANEQGEVQSGWMRGTRCLRKQGEDWKVVHEHCSMPFDMQTMQADFSQQP